MTIPTVLRKREELRRNALEEFIKNDGARIFQVYRHVRRETQDFLKEYHETDKLHNSSNDGVVKLFDEKASIDFQMNYVPSQEIRLPSVPNQSVDGYFDQIEEKLLKEEKAKKLLFAVMDCNMFGNYYDEQNDLVGLGRDIYYFFWGKDGRLSVLYSFVMNKVCRVGIELMMSEKLIELRMSNAK